MQYNPAVICFKQWTVVTWIVHEKLKKYYTLQNNLHTFQPRYKINVNADIWKQAILNFWLAFVFVTNSVIFILSLSVNENVIGVAHFNILVKWSLIFMKFF